MHATGHTSTHAPSFVHSRVMTYGTRAALRGDQRQIGADDVRDMHAAAEFRGHELAGSIERAELRRRGEARAIERGRRGRAESELANPRAQHERDEESVLHR